MLDDLFSNIYSMSVEKNNIYDSLWDLRNYITAPKLRAGYNILSKKNVKISFDQSFQERLNWQINAWNETKLEYMWKMYTHLLTKTSQIEEIQSILDDLKKRTDRKQIIEDIDKLNKEKLTNSDFWDKE